MGDIMKIVQYYEESGLLIKDISETIKNKEKEQKSGFLGMLLGALSAHLFENMLARKGVIRCGDGVITAGEEVIGVEQDF